MKRPPPQKQKQQQEPRPPRSPRSPRSRKPPRSDPPRGKSPHSATPRGDPPSGKPPRGRLPSNIVILGLVSFFTDISTEMVYPILPLYLTAVLGASPAIIGIIEGIAESLASIVKIFSGMLADAYASKKKHLAFIGYFLPFFNKVVIILSVTWPGVLLARIIDRFGKGIRTAPRDALIAESASRDKLGGAFGLHKALDMLGASTGILIAFFLMLFLGAGDVGGADASGVGAVATTATTATAAAGAGAAASGSGAVGTPSPDTFRIIFLVSMIPALIGPLCVLFVKNTAVAAPRRKLDFKWRSLDTRLKLFLVTIFVFTLGNSSNAFILLRAAGAGFSTHGAILLYFVFNVVASILSYPLGRLSDRVGRKYTLCVGYLLYGVVYLGIGLLSSAPAFWGLFALYGAYTALTVGGERALIAEIAPAHLKGSALGLHAAITGIGLLPASLIAGVLWDSFGQSAPFIFGGVLALLASAAVFAILNRRTVAG